MVGIDFGHAHVAVAVADVEGRVLDEERSEVHVDTQARAALDTASGVVFRLLGRPGHSFTDVSAIAAGVPAPLVLDGAVYQGSPSCSERLPWLPRRRCT